MNQAAIEFPDTQPFHLNGVLLTNLEGRRVLVVDDERDTADLVGLMLQVFGADVRIAYAGQTALALVEGGWVPDAVLSDLRMPGMDGWELGHRLRERSETAHTRLIALTGWDWQGDRKRTEQAGFDGYLLKPLALHEFAAALEGLRRPA